MRIFPRRPVAGKVHEYATGERDPLVRSLGGPSNQKGVFLKSEQEGSYLLLSHSDQHKIVRSTLDKDLFGAAQQNLGLKDPAQGEEASTNGSIQSTSRTLLPTLEKLAG